VLAGAHTMSGWWHALTGKGQFHVVPETSDEWSGGNDPAIPDILMAVSD